MIQKFFKISFLILFTYCLLFITSSVEAAKLYLAPSSQTVYQDNSFIVDVRLDTEGEEINTVGVNLTYSSDLLEVIDISKGNSILTLWLKEPVSKEGQVSLVGGMPNGFQGEDGLIARLIFRARKIGKGKVDFKKDSKVLLNNGKGTEAELNFLAGNYEIIRKPEKLPVISSKTHPDQSKWYQGTTLHLHWHLVEGAEYSYLLSYDPLAEPDEVADKPEGELIWMGDIEYKGLENGIYYFHLRQATRDKRQELKWGPKVTFRAMIDATPPEEFEPQITEIEGEKYLIFLTEDKSSGVEYYEVKEGRRNFKKAVSPYLLEDQNLGGLIKVRAVDKAGNERIAEIRLPYKMTLIDIVALLSVLIGIGIILGFRKKKSQT